MSNQTIIKINPPSQKLVYILGVVIFALGFLVLAPGTVYAADKVNLETCATCHEDQVAAFKNQVHAAIDAKALAGNAGAAFSCTACHGDVSKHIEEGEKGTIMAFSKSDTPVARSKACLKCHTTGKMKFFAGSHAKASMGCTDCHSIHKHQSAKLVKGGGTKSCAKCHEDIFAYFNLNERHRLQEGIMECTSCHDPHKPTSRLRLSGLKNKTCYKCHTDKKGPFMYEHAAVRVEGCATCHNVHGSPNRHMLKNQKVADLCYSCHTNRPGWHATLPNVHDQNCAVCHSAIHGSNLSRKFTK